MSHGSVLIALNLAKIARDYAQNAQTHACALCDRQTSINRPVCPICAKGLE